MYGSNFFQNYVAGILNDYKRWQPLYLTIPIGFNGSTANERVTVYTPQVDADALVFGFNVDFSNASVTVKISDTASGYVWNVFQSPIGGNPEGSPITAIAGIQTQVMPVLPLVCPYWLSKQSKLQLDFRNSATSLTTGGNITAIGLKLLK